MDNPNHDDRPISYYQVGTLELTKDSPLVTGFDTYWLSDLPCNYNIPRPIVGNLLTIDNANFYVIKDVISDTEIELAIPYAESSETRTSYAVITSTFVDPSEVGVDIAKLNHELVDGLQKILDVKAQAEDINNDILNIKSETAQYRDEAQQSAQDAANSDLSAQTHEQNTQQLKDDTEVIKQQTDAIKQATNLVLVNTQNIKDDTQAIHDQTDQLKTEASQWSDKAHEWATKQHGVVVDNSEYSSKHWAEESEASANKSHASEIESQKWANNPENQVVSGNEYSAKHYDAKAKEALSSANIAAKKAEAARDSASVSAAKTANALVHRGDWQPSTGLPSAPNTNSIWYVAASESEPSNPNINWQAGDYLVYDHNGSKWSRLTGEPLAPHTPGPLKIDNNIIMKPDKAIRFEAFDDDPDPIYAVGMHRTQQNKNRLLYGDYTTDDVEEIVIAIPNSDNLLVSEQLDQANDWQPVPSKTFQILTTKNGVSKSGGEFTGAVKCAIPPNVDADLVNLKWVKDESGRLVGVINGEISNLKTLIGTKLTKAQADKLYMRPEYATLQWERIVGGDITKAITPAHLQALDLSTNIQNDQKYVKLGGSSMTGDLHFASGKGISDSGQNHLLTWVGINFYSGNVSHTLNLRSKTEPVLTIGSKDYSLYHTGHKPTAAELGALTQASADGRYLGKTAKAHDTDLFDGVNSDRFFITGRGSLDLNKLVSESDHSINPSNVGTGHGKATASGATGAYYCFGGDSSIGKTALVGNYNIPYYLVSWTDNNASRKRVQKVFTDKYPPTASQVGALAANGKAATAGTADKANLLYTRTSESTGQYNIVWLGSDNITTYNTNGKIKFQPSSGNFFSAGMISAAHGYDHAGYFRTLGETDKGLKITNVHSNNNKSVWIGCRNTSYAHFDTDAPLFYSYKPWQFHQGINVESRLDINGHHAIRATDTSWLRINDEKSFTSGTFFGATLVRTDGIFTAGSWGANKTTRIAPNFYDSTWGQDGTAAYSAQCSNSSGAHWLLASYYDSSHIRSGIQVLSNTEGRMRFYTNNRGHYVEIAGGAILAQGNITAYSDERLKTNLERIPNALDKVMKISGYTFDRTDGNYPRQAGVIAQEVEKVLPEVVSEDADGIKNVAYGNMVGLLIEAIKDLKTEINELKGVNK